MKDSANFLLFAGDNYYPAGGFFDLKGEAKTLEEARDIFTKHNATSDYYDQWGWGHIVDINTRVIVEEL